MEVTRKNHVVRFLDFGIGKTIRSTSGNENGLGRERPSPFKKR